MTEQLQERSIIVTGAARGIGEGIACGLAASGALVTIADIDEQAAEKAANRIRHKGGRAIGVAANVVDRADVKGMLDAAQAAFGPLHGIINNAGIAQSRPFLDITEADWRMIMEVNSLGVMICMQEAAKRMIAQGNGGKILNVASVGAKQGFEPLAHYCASKFSVVAFTQAAAKALGKHRITVNAICPGVVATDMWRVIGEGYKEAGFGETDETAFNDFSAGIVLGRPSTPEDLTGVTRFLMSSDSDYMTGQAVVVDGGMVFS
ncbi:SDR family NAD(P)-dependent oxidoreductase [Rhizorhabdus argentea]|uniref:SDR family NAD(P)-dependent oxidoreductase n=1 Tax=Rhizorhabdus argentea TaxID=1387174 RepID=UPI0030ECF982